MTKKELLLYPIQLFFYHVIMSLYFIGQVKALKNISIIRNKTFYESMITIIKLIYRK